MRKIIFTLFAATALSMAIGTSDTEASTYTVQPGDTLWKIAKKYGSTVDDIVRVNGIENPDKINNDRLQSWNTYYELLTPLKEKGCIDLPVVPAGCVHNAHMFYIKTKDLEERSRLIAFLKENGIGAVFHYIPLHSSPAGQQFSRFHGEDKYTTKESERLLRLPMYYGLEKKDI